MRLTGKDVAATCTIALLVVPYVIYLIDGEVLFIGSPRGMAVLALVLGMAACAAGDPASRQHLALIKVAGVFGATALVLGIATLVTNSEWLLAGTVAATVLAWLIATARHVIGDTGIPANGIGRYTTKDRERNATITR